MSFLLTQSAQKLLEELVERKLIITVTSVGFLVAAVSFFLNCYLVGVKSWALIFRIWDF